MVTTRRHSRNARATPAARASSPVRSERGSCVDDAPSLHHEEEDGEIVVQLEAGDSSPAPEAALLGEGDLEDDLQGPYVIMDTDTVRDQADPDLSPPQSPREVNREDSDQERPKRLRLRFSADSDTARAIESPEEEERQADSPPRTPLMSSDRPCHIDWSHELADIEAHLLENLGVVRSLKRKRQPTGQRTRVPEEPSQEMVPDPIGTASGVVLVQYPTRTLTPLESCNVRTVKKHLEEYDRLVAEWNKVPVPQKAVKRQPPTLVSTLSQKVRRIVAATTSSSLKVNDVKDKDVRKWVKFLTLPQEVGARVISQCQEAWAGVTMAHDKEECGEALSLLWMDMVDVLQRHGGEESLLIANRSDDTRTVQIKKRMNQVMSQDFIHKLVPNAMKVHVKGMWDVDALLRADARATYREAMKKVDEINRNCLYPLPSRSARTPAQLRAEGAQSTTPQYSSSAATRQQGKKAPKAGKKSGSKSSFSGAGSERSKSVSEAKKRTPEEMAAIEKRCKERGVTCDHCHKPHWVSMCPTAPPEVKKTLMAKRRASARSEFWKGTPICPNRKVVAGSESREASESVNERQPREAENDVAIDVSNKHPVCLEPPRGTRIESK